MSEKQDLEAARLAHVQTDSFRSKSVNGMRIDWDVPYQTVTC